LGYTTGFLDWDNTMIGTIGTNQANFLGPDLVVTTKICRAYVFLLFLL